jgi:hypothetical protein
MAFVERQLSVTFRLSGSRTFAGGNNQVTITNHRITAHVTNVGTPTGSTLSMTIYGMTLSLMNQLSTLGMVIQLVPKDTILVQAGDAGGQQNTVFAGTILNAWSDFQPAPEVAFHVQAQAGLADAVAPVPPSSFQGSADVATIMQGLAGKMTGSTGKALNFENNGVSVKLSNPYFPGTLRQQAYALAKHAGINIEIANDTLAIWPSGKTREGTVPVISPQSGLQVGYPSFTPQGILVKTVFNPQLKFGGQFKLQGSQITPANNTWAINFIDLSLESQTPHGEWFSMIGGYNPNFEPPLRAPVT